MSRTTTSIHQQQQQQQGTDTVSPSKPRSALAAAFLDPITSFPAQAPRSANTTTSAGPASGSISPSTAPLVQEAEVVGCAKEPWQYTSWCQDDCLQQHEHFVSAEVTSNFGDSGMARERSNTGNDDNNTTPVSDSDDFLRRNDDERNSVGDADDTEPQPQQQHATSSTSVASAAAAAAAESAHADATIKAPTFVPVFESLEALLPRHNVSTNGQVPWICSNCSSSAFGHKCSVCHRGRDAAALRVFVGQLSREGTPEIVNAMLHTLCPDLSAPALHVEAHTHAATGRGKGCAWVYVHHFDDIAYVVRRIHKRTFVTLDRESGRVGFMAFPDDYDEIDIRGAFDAIQGALPEDVQSLLHRSPVTAEVPVSMLRRSNNNNNNSSNQYQQQQQQQHHDGAYNNNNSNNNARRGVNTSSRPQPFSQQQPQYHHQQQQYAGAFTTPAAPSSAAANALGGSNYATSWIPEAGNDYDGSYNGNGNNAGPASQQHARRWRWNPYAASSAQPSAY